MFPQESISTESFGTSMSTPGPQLPIKCWGFSSVIERSSDMVSLVATTHM